MEIKTLKIGDIHPYEKNPRKNDKSVAAVARSIEEFGWQQPIVVDVNHEIICGHTRYKAAKKLGMKEVSERAVRREKDRYLERQHKDRYSIRSDKGQNATICQS